MTRRRIVKTLLLVVGLAVAAFFYQATPHEQTVHVELGKNAPQVSEVRLRYTAASHGAFGPRHDESDPAREVSMLYRLGSAPSVVTHEPRLPNGDYLVDLEIHTDTTIARSRKTVALGGSPITIPTYDLLSASAASP